MYAIICKTCITIIKHSTTKKTTHNDTHTKLYNNIHELINCTFIIQRERRVRRARSSVVSVNVRKLSAARAIESRAGGAAFSCVCACCKRFSDLSHRPRCSPLSGRSVLYLNIFKSCFHIFEYMFFYVFD